MIPPRRFASATTSLAKSRGPMSSRLNSTPEFSPFLRISRSSVRVMDSDLNDSAPEIRQRHNLLGQIPRSNVVPLEFDTGVFSIPKDFEKFGARHGFRSE